MSSSRPELSTHIGGLNYRVVIYAGFNCFVLSSVFFVPWSWDCLAIALGTFYARMFAVTGIYHRYFAHRSYKMKNRPVRFLLAAWATTAALRGPLWWAATHRWHHRHSDGRRDIHSRRHRGFGYAHLLWVFDMYKNDDWDPPRLADLRCYPELIHLERWNLLGPLALGGLLYALGGISWLVWGLGVSTIALWHAASSVNSVNHRPGAQARGEQRFDTGDDSRNLWWSNLFTLGEGWHNNHHHYPAAARNGFYPSELDPTYGMLRLFAWVGLIEDLVEVPQSVLDEGRASDARRAQQGHPPSPSA